MWQIAEQDEANDKAHKTRHKNTVSAITTVSVSDLDR